MGMLPQTRVPTHVAIRIFGKQMFIEPLFIPPRGGGYRSNSNVDAMQDQRPGDSPHGGAHQAVENTPGDLFPEQGGQHLAPEAQATVDAENKRLVAIATKDQ